MANGQTNKRCLLLLIVDLSGKDLWSVLVFDILLKHQVIWKMVIAGSCEQPSEYLRGEWLAQQIHSIVSPAGVRTAKRVDQMLKEYGVMSSERFALICLSETWGLACGFSIFPLIFQVLYFIISKCGHQIMFELVLISRQWNPQVHSKPKVPTAAVCAEHLELRRELLNLLQLQKQVLICHSF